MFILVKINRSYDPLRSSDPMLAASGDWNLGGLLNGGRYTRYRILIAVYKGQVAGAFRIISVAKAPGSTAASEARVRFRLGPLPLECASLLASAFDSLLNRKHPAMKFQRPRYFEWKALKDAVEPTDWGPCFQLDGSESPDFNSSILAEPERVNEIHLPQHDLQNPLPTLACPTGIWYQIRIIRQTWDSFAQQNAAHVEWHITVNPHGRITANLERNGNTSTLKLNEAQTDLTCYLLARFNADPAALKSELEQSVCSVHPAHTNHFDIEVASFEDAEFKRAIHRLHWHTNVLFCERGLLKVILLHFHDRGFA